MSSTNWWANKLGGQPQPVSYPPVTNPNAQPAPVNPYMPGAVQSLPPQYSGQQLQPAGAFESHVIPDSSKSDTKCPSCREDNYLLVGSQVTQNGAVEVRRCFNCGYPKVQAGSGVGTIGGGQGAARPARQVPTGGWNPGVIIAKI